MDKQDLILERANLIKAQEEFVLSDGFTKEESDQRAAAIDKLNARIEAIAAVEKNKASATRSLADKVARPDIVPGKVLDHNDSVRERSIFDRRLRGWELSQEDRNYLETRALATGTATGGAELVNNTYSDEVLVILNDVSGVLDVMSTYSANVHITPDGSPLHFPTISNGSNAGAITSEGGALTVTQDAVTAELILKEYNFNGTIQKINNQMLDNSAYDLIGALTVLHGNLIGEKLNEALTVGAGGGSAVQGVVVGSSLGATAVDNTTISIADFVALKESQKNSKKASSVFMFNSTTFSALQLLLNVDNSYSFWGYKNFGDSMVPTILGNRYVINDDMANIGNSAKSVLFWHPSGYKVRMVRGIQTKIFTELYGVNHQTGFLSWLRADGGVYDSTVVKHLLHPAS